MTSITHHLNEAILHDYVTGRLEHAFSIAVSAHMSLCGVCRARAESLSAQGGAVLDDCDVAAPGAHVKERVLARLDIPEPPPDYERKGIYPAPIMAALAGRAIRWQALAKGIRQQVIYRGAAGTARLLYIPQGRRVPDHGHGGLELTLVLQGSFSDEQGTYGRGDIEVADQDLCHTPVAGEGAPCICLAATDARLRFDSLTARLLQPILGI